MCKSDGDIEYNRFKSMNIDELVDSKTESDVFEKISPNFQNSWFYHIPDEINTEKDIIFKIVRHSDNGKIMKYSCWC